MYRRYLMAAALFVITACAAPGPTPPPSVAEPEEPSANIKTSEPQSVVEVATIPSVPVATVDHAAENIFTRKEMVCRRERRTGTHRATRVCRTREEMERLEIESKETFRDLNRSQNEFE